MSSHKNFSDSMAEEVLTDMADTFFGARKELENTIKAFQSLAETLREKETEVDAGAGFLNHLLLYGKAGTDFYTSIKVDTPSTLLESKIPDRTLLPKVPFAITSKGKFIKLVLRAYDTLQKVCNEYINGKYYTDPEEKVKRLTVHYKQLIIMCKIINEDIQTINRNLTPACVLEFAKGLDYETREKERITGGTLDAYACSIQEKLEYKPIDFDSLHLKKYPKLPKKETVISEIKSFCRNLYNKNKADIDKLISDLEKREGKV
ncbi:MAG: hypothetical protein JRG68_04815 [Deltaproteobacteria bacterium]|nr:hypothetical protein [Deltaproteobacteria bacterium]